MRQRVEQLEEELRELYFDMEQETIAIQKGIQHLESPEAISYERVFQMEDRVIEIKKELNKLRK